MRSPGAMPWLAAAVLHFGCLVAGQLSDAPSADNFVRRFSNAVVVLGNYAYLDGGEIIQIDGGKTSSARIVNSTLSVDLTTSWTTTDVQFKSIEKQGIPSKGNAAVWTNPEGTAFYSWGGKSPYAVGLTTPALYKFTADGSGGGSWGVETPQNPTLFNGLLPAEYPAFTTVNNTMYAVGGVVNAWTMPKFSGEQAIPGMITFNMATREWTNVTGFDSPASTLTAARIQSLPSFGPGGLLLVLGGHAPRADVAPTIANSRLNDFTNLVLFDPIAVKRYTQTATGDIPTFPRAGFCIASFQNKQGGQEIFIFGGENTNTKVRYQDAYVLSLPGFVWTKVPTPPGGGRAFFSCAAVGKRQVLSVGGLEFTEPGKDDAPKGLLVYDMTAMRWKDSYDAALPDYERPAAIEAWYKSGGLDKVSWASKEVQALFVTESGAPKNGGGGTGAGGSGGGSGNGGAGPAIIIDDTDSKTSTGAVAGGVVGGVAALAAIAGGLWFFLRRRKQKREQLNVSPEQPTVPEMAAPGQLYPGHPGILPAGYHQARDGKRPALIEADSDNHYSELPPAELPPLGHKSFAAELDGETTARR